MTNTKTIAQLVSEYNEIALAQNIPTIKSWKKSRESLIEKLASLYLDTGAEPVATTEPVIVPEATTASFEAPPVASDDLGDDYYAEETEETTDGLEVYTTYLEGALDATTVEPPYFVGHYLIEVLPVMTKVRTIQEVAIEFLNIATGVDEKGRITGLAYAEVLRMVLAVFPEAKTTYGCLRWYAAKYGIARKRPRSK